MKANPFNLSLKNFMIISLLILFQVAGFTRQAWADGLSYRPASGSTIHDQWVRATDEELAQQRGGFVLPNGVTVDISLERIIFLNGMETITTYFQFPENGVLLHNGSENLALDSMGPALSTIIQNNLDDQVIKAINDINIEISNLQHIGEGLNNLHNSLDSLLPILQ